MLVMCWFDFAVDSLGVVSVLLLSVIFLYVVLTVVEFGGGVLLLLWFWFPQVCVTLLFFMFPLDDS